MSIKVSRKPQNGTPEQIELAEAIFENYSRAAKLLGEQTDDIPEGEYELAALNALEGLCPKPTDSASRLDLIAATVDRLPEPLGKRDRRRDNAARGVVMLLRSGRAYIRGLATSDRMALTSPYPAEPSKDEMLEASKQIIESYGSNGAIAVDSPHWSNETFDAVVGINRLIAMGILHVHAVQGQGSGS